MKIIDILVKMTDGTLEDRFEFRYIGTYWAYFKKIDEIQRIRDGSAIGYICNLTKCLNDEVEAIEENKEIEGLKITDKDRDNYNRFTMNIADKANELVRAINKITKEIENRQLNNQKIRRCV